PIEKTTNTDGTMVYRVPAETVYRYDPEAGKEKVEESAFDLAVPPGQGLTASPGGGLVLPEGAKRLVPGSSWGTFTITCTIPIALFVGWSNYRFRKGEGGGAAPRGA